MGSNFSDPERMFLVVADPLNEFGIRSVSLLAASGRTAYEAVKPCAFEMSRMGVRVLGDSVNRYGRPA